MICPETEIFVSKPDKEQKEEIFEEEASKASIPYLQKGDSSMYIGQFLDQSRDNLSSSTSLQNGQSTEMSLHIPEIIHESEHEDSSKARSMMDQNHQSETKSNQPSIFHNFQKHLIIALRNIVKIQHPNPEEPYMDAAKQLWATFLNSTVTAKKILHCLLSDDNKHSTNSKMLQKYGFKEIYDYFSGLEIAQAKAYLRSQVIRQLTSIDLARYTAKRRIKDSNNFTLYISEFIKELETGYLQKRIKKTDVLE